MQKLQGITNCLFLLKFKETKSKSVYQQDSSLISKSTRYHPYLLFDNYLDFVDKQKQFLYLNLIFLVFGLTYLFTKKGRERALNDQCQVKVHAGALTSLIKLMKEKALRKHSLQ